jgi:hypothetical protein
LSARRILIGLGIVVKVAGIVVILATRADNERSPADDPDTLLLGVEGNLGSRYRPDEVRSALDTANRGNELQAIVGGGDSRTGSMCSCAFS